MDIKKSLKKSLNEWARKHDSSPLERSTGKFGRNMAYHGFFEGYTEIRVPKASGRGTRIQRIYTGAHYKPELSFKQMVLLRVFYAALYVLSVILFVKSALMDVMSNYTWYITIFQACTVPMIAWMFIALIYYLPVREQLEIPEYKRSSRALKRSTLVASICMAAAAVFALLFALISGSDNLFGELLSALLFALSSAMFFIINRIESGIDYQWIDSTVEKPSDGVEID